MRPSLPNPFSEPMTNEVLQRYLEVTVQLYEALRKVSELYETSDLSTHQQRTLIRHVKQCLDSCEAAALLSSKAMYVPATAVVRMGLEHVFYFVACVNDPDYWSLLQASDEQSTRKQIRILVERGQMLPGSVHVGEELGKSASQSIEIVARRAGLLSLYDTTYRSLSQYGAHATTARIEEVFSDPDVAEKSGVDFRACPQHIWPAYLLSRIQECLRELHTAINSMVSPSSGPPSP